MNLSLGQVCWCETGDTFGSIEPAVLLRVQKGGNALVRTCDGRERQVGEASLAPHPNAAALEGVTGERGLLWRNGRVIDVCEADALARKVGIMYAEQLVALLGGSYRRVQS